MSNVSIGDQMTIHTANQEDARASAGASARARAHAGIEPVDFPVGVGAYLIQCREWGFTFEEAWTPDLVKAALRAGFKDYARRIGEESALSFAKRHFKAAYEGRDTSSYCVVMQCAELQLNKYGLCSAHANYEGNDDVAASG